MKNGKVASVPGTGQGRGRLVAKEVREVKGVRQEAHREFYYIIKEPEILFRNCFENK